MIKELYQNTVREVSISVSQSKVDAVMKKNIKKSGCRVYDNGFIGVAGTLGDPTVETWRQAEENLNSRIPYPFEPEKNSKRVRDLRELKISDEDFIAHVEEVLSTLRSEFPDFIFSNKMKMVETEISLSNSIGLDYVNYDKTIVYSLLVKHIDSVNVFDTYIARQSRKLENKEFLQEARSMLKAFKNEKSLPEQETMPVIFTDNEILSKISESLNGEEVSLKTSLFSDKMQTKAFCDKFSVYQDKTEENMHNAFFDTEGVTNPQDTCFLIKDGVIEKAYTDKSIASRFSMPLTGSAGGVHDDVPSLKSTTMSVIPSEKTLKELLNGELAALVIMASGGDYTSAGDYASPVQVAYLTDGGNIIARLPEFNISGNMYDFFGKDYLGFSKDRPFFGERCLVLRMKVNK